MELIDIITSAGLIPKEVTVMFHVGDKPKIHRDLPRLVQEEPHLFDMFQNHHSSRQEATVKSRKFMMSFVATPHRGYVLAGVYQVCGHQYLTNAELDADPLRVVMRERYDEPLFERDKKHEGGRLVFDLQLTDCVAALRGKLCVNKPKDRAYARKAETLLNCPVIEISREAMLVGPLPPWDHLVFDKLGVQTIPQIWAAKMQEWRGIYHIVDRSDGARYVGSAYGQDNILGRWQAHIAGDKGVTAELAKRDTENFVFSILELLAPNAAPEDVVLREGLWKERLGTRGKMGLNKN